MNQNHLSKKILGIGCAVTILFTILGAVIAPLTFVIVLASDPAYQNAPPGGEAVLVFGAIPFFLGGAVVGALLGALISGVIALVIWLRARKTT